SFCNKDQHAVRKLIAGPTVFICDECIEVCNQIIADDARLVGTAPVKPANDATDVTGNSPEIRCALCRMPTITRRALVIPDRGVLGVGGSGKLDERFADGRALEPCRRARGDWLLGRAFAHASPPRPTTNRCGPA